MMVLRPRDKNYYAHLENVIGWMEMEAFVCEDKDDANLLMKKLRKENNLLRINVVHSSAQMNEQFKHPTNLPKGLNKLFPKISYKKDIC